MQSRVDSNARARYPGLFGFERGVSAHHNALIAAMRHFESAGDDLSLGLVLVALVRGRKPWMMDLQYKYFKLARLERFSEVLLVVFRWIMRNISIPLDEGRRLLKKLEHHVPHRSKRTSVARYLYEALEGAGRFADAYDTARLSGRHDLMGVMRKKQMEEAIGRGTVDMYRPIDPVVWGRTARGGKSLLADAERHLNRALEENPEDSRCRIHLVELLLASGDEDRALDASRAGGVISDFDAQAQRIVLVLDELNRCLDEDASRSRKKLKKTSAAGVAAPTNVTSTLVDEVLDCCRAMLSLDPGSIETIELLEGLCEKGLVQGCQAERLADVLSLATPIGAVDEALDKLTAISSYVTRQ